MSQGLLMEINQLWVTDLFEGYFYNVIRNPQLYAKALPSVRQHTFTNKSKSFVDFVKTSF